MKECLIFFISACILILYVYKASSNREDYYLADYDKIPSCECSKMFLTQDDV